MIRTIFYLTALVGLLAGCTRSSTPVPAPFPPDSLPTIVALTGQAAFATSDALTQSVSPTQTSLPIETPIPATPRPSPTPTFEPGFSDFAQIRFLSPGPMSKVISPLNLQVLLVAGESEIVQVDLLGEDGRVLNRKLERVTRDRAGLYRSFKLTFEIRAVSELGWIQISTKDDQGRIQALNTLQVLLFFTGSNEINPAGNIIYERVMLEGLKDGATVSGGVLTLKGRIWPFNTQPVFAELILPDGKPAGTRVLTFKGVDTESFETTIPYKVKEPVQARLTFRQVSPELDQLVYVYTQEIHLNP
jgi:hypothetical protein